MNSSVGAMLPMILVLNISSARLASADDREATAATDKAAESSATDKAANSSAAPVEEASEATSNVAKDADGVRFRGGVSGGAGAEIVFGTGTSVVAGMGGIDGRLGAQINNLFAVYAQPHVSFGSFGTGLGFGGFTGTAAATVLADFTFIDRIFVAAGAGYGVLNNPHGPVIHIRAGGYPVMGDGEGGIRRKGLMVGADVRIFVTTSDLVAVYPMASIGYEAF